MTWRAFVNEEPEPDVEGNLVHVLDCGHRVTALNGRSSGDPVARRWCKVCSPPPAPPPYVAIRREHIQYALAILQGRRAGGDLERMELCDAAILAFETALRRTEQNANQLIERGSVEELSDG